MDLQKYIERLFDDEALRSNMSDAYGAIWLYAGCEHLREVARDRGDLEAAYQVVRAGIAAVNAAMRQPVKSK